MMADTFKRVKLSRFLIALNADLEPRPVQPPPRPAPLPTKEKKALFDDIDYLVLRNNFDNLQRTVRGMERRLRIIEARAMMSTK